MPRAFFAALCFLWNGFQLRSRLLCVCRVEERALGRVVFKRTSEPDLDWPDIEVRLRDISVLASQALLSRRAAPMNALHQSASGGSRGIAPSSRHTFPNRTELPLGAVVLLRDHER